MKGLLLRLSALDPDAATALRVIAHFEALLSGAPDPVSLVRSTAGLAECPAGLELADGRTVRFGPDGHALAGVPERVSGAAVFGPAARVPAVPDTAGERDGAAAETGTGTGIAATGTGIPGGTATGSAVPGTGTPGPGIAGLVGGREQGAAERAAAEGPYGGPDPAARPDSAVAPAPGETPSGPSGRVWLERPGAPGPLDELVLEWMALAARVVVADNRRPREPEPPHVADPALVELVLSEREAVEDRARALRLLGLTPELPLRVLAVAGGPGTEVGVEAVALLGRSGLRAVVRIAGVGELGAVLVQPRDGETASPAEELRAVTAERMREAGAARQSARRVRAGVGGSSAALEARTSWTQARNALRFAVAGDPAEAVIDHDALGPVALLAEIPVELLHAQPDVRALAALAEGETDGTGIAALAAFCRTGSLRQAATELHLHHSSVAARLAQVEGALGWR
ncbi:hypothetical protein, partial [Streptomyces sp. Ru87]|uniref:PucR family transcriptional regulator n=1 Tax=Streptomyces sp. Ru87 TaxID=2044307 RepID=UPI00117F4D8C